MPGMTTEEFGGAEDWQDGFTKASGGLWCKTCHCLVQQNVSSVRAHKEWDEKVQRLFARTLGER